MDGSKKMNSKQQFSRHLGPTYLQIWKAPLHLSGKTLQNQNLFLHVLTKTETEQITQPTTGTKSDNQHNIPIEPTI